MSTTPLLEIRDLALHAGTSVIVEKLDLSVDAGQCVAIVGESGAGKSMTGRALMGLLPAGIKVESGTITFDGTALYTNGQPISERAWRTIRGNRIAMVTQDALVSLDPLRTIGAEVSEPALVHHLIKPRDASTHATALLERVHVPEPHLRRKQYPHQLSGGQRQRALIASGLSATPELLIADEPTTALDAHVQGHIIDLLKEVREAGTAVILISHDLTLVSELADYVVVMRSGQVVEQGPATDVLTAPTAQYTKDLLAAHPDGTPLRVEQRPVDTSRTILQATNIGVTYRQPGGGSLDALNGVSLAVHGGETVGLVGESGSGKSTLLRVLLGLTEPHTGNVEFNGHPWSSMPERLRRGLRPDIQLIAQDPYSAMNKRWTVERIIAEGLRKKPERPKKAHTPGESVAPPTERVRQLMNQVGLGAELAQRKPNELSGGQRQRVAIARALAAEPLILLCDEPVSALDVTIAAQVVNLLVRLQEETGIAMVFISHDHAVVRQLAHTVVELNNGAIVDETVVGETEDVTHVSGTD